MMAKKNLRELVLALALFFNPLGYNEVFYGIMKLTGTYLGASIVMYCFAFILFMIYLGLRIYDKKHAGVI